MVTVGPSAIEVRDLRKSYRMRVSDPRGRGGIRLRARGYRFDQVPVLDGVSFDVAQGEMFGVVGRNGSGKSTLLKILASIYEADGGEVIMKGRAAPFVELGAGLHPELTAWDNVRTSAVMMGLTPQEAHERFDEIIEFAELEDFQGLELKNYSAGMKTRLTFATLLKIDADVFLFDEILAAGDATFHEKSAAAFKELCEKGKTIVLASHSLGAIRRECNRALLLHEGTVERIGDPEEVTAHYLELHRQRQHRGISKRPPLAAAVARQAAAAQITEVWLEDSAGRVVSKVPTGEQLELHALVEMGRGGKDPVFACELHDDDDGSLVRTLTPQPLGGPQRRVRRGDRVHARSTLGGDLSPGPYVAACRVLRAGRNAQMTPMSEPSLLDFSVSRPGGARSAQSAPRHDRSGLPEREAAARL